MSINWRIVLISIAASLIPGLITAFFIYIAGWARWGPGWFLPLLGEDLHNLKLWMIKRASILRGKPEAAEETR